MHWGSVSGANLGAIAAGNDLVFVAGFINRLTGKRLIASTGDRVVMAQDVDSLLAALVTTEGRKPAVVTSTSAPTPGARGPELPPSGASSEALNRYRRAFDALSKGDWRTFGTEMDAMQKALQGAPAAKSPP